MSNPKIRNLVIAFGSLVVLLILYFVVVEVKGNKKSENKDEETVEESIALFSIGSDKISKISFTNEYGDHNFTYSVDTDLWTSSEHPEWTLDTTKIDAMLMSLSNILSTRKISEPDELSEYKLDNPSLKVSLEGKDGDNLVAYSFMIGASIPSGEGYYYMEENGTEVYIVDNAIVTAFGYKDNQFMAVDKIDAIDSNNIYSVDISKNDGSKLISYNYDGDKTNDTVTSNWVVTAPYDGNILGNESYISEYMSKYTSLAYTECVDFSPTDLAQYGLDNPQYTINLKYFSKEEVKDENADSENVEDKTDESESAENTSNESEQEEVITHKELTYSIGSAVMGSSEESEDSLQNINSTDDETEKEEVPLYYYVKSNISDKVYLMSAETINSFIEIDAFNFVNKYVNDKDIMLYDNLTISYNDNDYVIKKESVTETDESGNETINNVYSINGVTKSTTDGEDVCRKISTLKLARSITEQVTDNNVIAQFKYNGGEGDIIIQFLPYNDTFYRVNKNGMEYFLVEKQDVENTINAVVKLSE